MALCNLIKFRYSNIFYNMPPTFLYSVNSIHKVEDHILYVCCNINIAQECIHHTRIEEQIYHICIRNTSHNLPNYINKFHHKHCAYKVMLEVNNYLIYFPLFNYQMFFELVLFYLLEFNNSI